MLNFHLNEFRELEGGMRKDGIFKTGKKTSGVLIPTVRLDMGENIKLAKNPMAKK